MGRQNKEDRDMIAVLGYGCNSAAGQGVKDLWHSLVNGTDNATGFCYDDWPDHVRAYWNQLGYRTHKAYFFRSKRPPEISCADFMVEQLLASFAEAKEMASCSFLPNEKIGIILASTKGCVEDYVWKLKEADNVTLQEDLLALLLQKFITRSELKPQRALCVSNACASSHGAMAVARHWLTNNLVDKVLVVAADIVGPFILTGFASLRSLSLTAMRPFSAVRDGLRVGEAATAIILGRVEGALDAHAVIESVALDSEGHAVTRPSTDGGSLKRACATVLKHTTPNLIIAHGTATQVNDKVEDEVIAELFSEQSTPVVTAAKWCVGHTMGASGSIDLIAGCEILKNKKVFSLPQGTRIDSALKASYVVESHVADVERILITSLGFGGYHGALMLAKKEVV